MRTFLTLTLLGALAACGNASTGPSVAQQLIGLLRAGQQPDGPRVDGAALRAGITPEIVAQTGGGVLIVDIPARGAVAALGRVGVNGDVMTFLTPDGISISTKRGMIVATRGLGNDLMIADVAEPLATLAGQRQQAVRIHEFLDGENQTVSRSFMCTYARAASNQIIESCRADDLAFENTYTLAADGRIAQAKQWISPEIGYVITAEFLSPPT
ncbi:YjbF family lipoprotein [Yoonia sp. 2307UL14-13]|uniref:YjbF family lipoprotein n=1 Tax=Yoonia sp. 2307UL14-13 TaxID=3126506 RepID=UPI0030AFBF8F